MAEEPQLERRLYQPEELPGLLQLTEEQIGRLMRTGQLCKIRICGEERIDSHEVDKMIESYKQVAQRRREYERKQD